VPREQDLKAMRLALKPVSPGELGADLTTDQGYQAARLCGLAHLGMMKAALDMAVETEVIVQVKPGAPAGGARRASRHAPDRRSLR
jgi:hypothetical protein